ncbi:MAG: hypothetical protein D6694_03885 [Gammaproteobacteria bacterium]|nr:MAG: hypothetical protein D6694_03885 [Gammaproteobacteria bacterium]
MSNPNLIANNSTVGINYTSHGGIYLGGTATTATTEAEICWGCHDANGVSEWGTNTDTNGAEPNYDFGTIYSDAAATKPTSNWVGAYWKSATPIFGYKTGQIQSTHAASNNTGAQSGVDTVASIRCSYCHDVHNTFGPDGKPYLRGTWMGNPYPEDGAPQSSSSYTSSTSYRFGAVPRGNSGTPPRATGGYYIDQNRTTSGSYLNLTTWSLANNAGLCTLCHGTNVDDMNYYGTASTDWVGTNGHSNAVIGGTGKYKANIFDLRGGTRGNSTNPAMAFQGAKEPGDSGSYGFRNGEKNSDNWAPLLYGAPGELKRYNYYSWGATVDSNTIDTQYHKFPCSKCHNPHASRLPRLMITNCLDTKHNTWDDNQGTRNSSQYGSNNRNRHKSNLTSAQNCHRVGDPSESGTGAGWNNVTPW